MDDLLQIHSTVLMDGSTFTWFIQVLKDYKTKRTIGLAGKLMKDYESKLNS